MVPLFIYTTCIILFVLGAGYILYAYYWYLKGYKAAQSLSRENRYRLKFIGNMSLMIRKLSADSYWFSRGWTHGDNEAED